ncbi:hypothetical protein SLEP1_g39147 [Rubroshorea leprosula]|uniref:Fe2OG dioxygenase domain-containing protein n=1 Tax=Rubroshorea leprosula TaxID=152421 RepID=A0AAV5KZX3_9ROSI|nr:hypothetical protein SLEP1_g39147 [Rubroshorea leprosula]
MSNLEDPEVANSICDAAEKWAFFQIVNHGVPLEVLESVKVATHRFFGLPADEKKKYTKEHSPTTNVRFGTSFSPQAEKALEWKDFLSIFYVSEEEALAFWPPACSAGIHERVGNGRQSVATDSDEETQCQRNRRNKKISPEGFSENQPELLPCLSQPELTNGIGRHSDVSTLTILLQDEIGGLYVKNPHGNDSWIHVPPIEGSLVINVGDALQILSNGRYKSVEHRVVANRSKNRISVPIFVNPRPSDVIGPLPEVLADAEKPIYKQVLYSDYVRHFFKKAHITEMAQLNLQRSCELATYLISLKLSKLCLI